MSLSYVSVRVDRFLSSPLLPPLPLLPLLPLLLLLPLVFAGCSLLAAWWGLLRSVGYVPWRSPSLFLLVRKTPPLKKRNASIPALVGNA